MNEEEGVVGGTLQRWSCAGAACVCAMLLDSHQGVTPPRGGETPLPPSSSAALHPSSPPSTHLMMRRSSEMSPATMQHDRPPLCL